MARRRNGNGVEEFFEYSLDQQNRIIYLGSASYTYDDHETGVDYKMAENFIKALAVLDIQAPKGNKPITIIMNNPGGDFYHGLAIYDAIKTCKNKVIIMVYGMAMSMGALILQAADVRVMSAHARFMMHAGTDGYYGHAKDFERAAEECKKLGTIMEDILYDKMVKTNPNFTKKQLKRMLNFDTFLDAEETKKLGLCDEILKGRD